MRVITHMRLSRQTNATSIQSSHSHGSFLSIQLLRDLSHPFSTSKCKAKDHPFTYKRPKSSYAKIPNFIRAIGSNKSTSHLRSTLDLISHTELDLMLIIFPNNKYENWMNNLLSIQQSSCMTRKYCCTSTILTNSYTTQEQHLPLQNYMIFMHILLENSRRVPLMHANHMIFIKISK